MADTRLIERLNAERADAERLSDRHRARIENWIVGGNVGGLVATVAGLITGDVDRLVQPMLLQAAWCFTAGAFAGFFVILMLGMDQAARAGRLRDTIEAIQDESAPPAEPRDSFIGPLLLVVSFGCLALGVLVPLLQITEIAAAGKL